MNGILLVSDDEELKKNLTRMLNDLGHDVHSVSIDEKGYRALWEVHPDLILIDSAANPSILRSFYNELKLEQESREIPLIILVPPEIVKRFDSWDGIEDFILIPCRPEELEFRIRLVQRKKSWGHSRDGISLGDLFINFVGYEVRIQGAPVALTYKEYELLKFLVNHPNRVFTRNFLLERVWGYEAYVGTRTVDIHIRRLRSKLGSAGSGIQTVRNVGYKFTLAS